jgi:hypothetical protein
LERESHPKHLKGAVEGNLSRQHLEQLPLVHSRYHEYSVAPFVDLLC